MDYHDIERQRLIERICKLEPGRQPEELEPLTLGELAVLKKLAEAKEIRTAAGRGAGA
jgi:hypothetical protein